MTACLTGSGHDLRYTLTCNFSNTAGRHGHCIFAKNQTWGMTMSYLTEYAVDSVQLCSMLVVAGIGDWLLCN